MNSLHSAMVDACRSIGVTAPDTLPNPGKWIELDIDGDPHGEGDARIKLFPDGEGGVLYNWKSGEKQTFFVGGTETLTAEQRAVRQQAIAAARRQADENIEAERLQAATRAKSIYGAGLRDVQNHPYAAKKRVDLLSLVRRGAWPQRGWEDALLVPLYDAAGRISTLEAINVDGSKDFLIGGRKRGCFHPFGTLRGAPVVLVGEGLATVAAGADATGHPAAAAMDAGNLMLVAQTIKKDISPDALICVLSDNDVRADGRNPGVEAARAAAAAVGGIVVVPELDGKKCDLWDIWSERGPEAVAEAIASAIQAAQAPSDAPAAEYARNVDLIRASEIVPEAISWLWSGWLAAGKMNILGGAPGTGKTTIAVSLAATVSAGGRWPDGSKSPVGNVVIWSGEDDPADTLIPRLILAGADLTRVFFISEISEGNERRSFDPSRDMEPLKRKLVEIGGVKLLIVDPIVSAISGDSHKNAEVRRGLQPLVDLAGTMRCALLGITHFSKGTGGRDPVERLTGSLAFGALARVVLVAAKHQEEGEDGRTVRLFCRAKSNIGPDDGGYEYDLHQGELKTHPGIFTSSVSWGQAVEGAARELLATADATGDDGEGGTLADAKAFLADLLVGGPVPVKAIKADADGAGYSWATIRRAQKSLGIEAHKSGMRGGWEWSISPRCSRNTEDAQQNNVGTFRKSEHLQQENAHVEVEL